MYDIYYLAMSKEKARTEMISQEELRDISHKVRFEDWTPTATDFNKLYRYVGTEDGTRANVFEKWNRGSGRESERFERTIERSMSVGDIVIGRETGVAYMVKSMGWEAVPEIEKP